MIPWLFDEEENVSSEKKQKKKQKMVKICFLKSYQ